MKLIHRICASASLFLLASGATSTAQFDSENVTFLSRLRLSQIGGGSGSDVWGWTDSLTGRDYALMARSNGTSFVDVTDGSAPVFLGNLPSHTESSIWRDVKVYNDHAYIVSDGNGPHGMQVFDLANLRGVTSPTTFVETAHHDSFRNAHNIAINEDTGFAYIVGSDRAAGGLHILDLQNPSQPTVAGSFSADGYTHDAQAVLYSGPDTDYTGKELVFAANADTLTIADVTNKSATSLVARRGYPQTAYSHQGWLSEDQRYYFLGDELDERDFGNDTRIHVFDVLDVDNPQYVGFHEGPTAAIDHNMYVKGNHLFLANYRAGVQIFELTDPASADLTRVGFLDTYPGSNSANFDGAWSVFPFFDDGKFIVSDINRGLFVAQFDLLVPQAGDFDGDGDFTCSDIDALAAAIVNAVTDLDFDLNGDGLVNVGDRDTWLSLAGEAFGFAEALRVGDANLDGAVDASDFNLWNQSKFTPTAQWCQGDFNVDGFVDASDFNLWNANKFQSAAAVPEPTSILKGWILLLCGALCQRWRRHLAASRCRLMIGSTLLCILVVGMPHRTFGHAGSVSLFVNDDNQIYPLETFEFTQMQKFLDLEISADGPGFLVNFTSNGVIPGARFNVDVTQDLLYWDGVGLAQSDASIEFRAPQFDNQGIPNTSTVREYFVTHDSGVLTGIEWGTYNGAPFWESHGINFLRPLDAPAGIYGIGVTVHSQLHESSDPFLVPLIYDPLDALTPADEEDGVARLRNATAAYAVADVNRDGHIAVDDVDRLVLEIAQETHNLDFDLTRDGFVTDKDLVEWRRQAGRATQRLGGNILPGDANLDGVVDVSDFNAWNDNKFTAIAAWSRGDFNADGVVDVGDFNEWNEFKFQASDPALLVPEPEFSLLGLSLAFAFVGRRCRR